MIYSIQTSTKPTLGIRGHLLLGFAIIATLLIIAITIILVIVTTTKKFEMKVINTDLPTYNAFLEIDKHLFRLSSSARGWMLTQDPRFKTERDATLASLERFQASTDELATHWTNDELKKNWAEIKFLFNQYKLEQDKVQNIADEKEAIHALMIGPFVIYNKILTLVNGPMNASGERTGGMFESQYINVQNGTNKIIHDMELIQIILYILLFSSIVICTITAILTARKILKPLDSAIEVAKHIASGKRNVDIVITSHDETGELLSALKVMQESIKDNEDKLQQSEEKSRTLFENIVQTANDFSVHSSKVAAGDLTQRLQIESSDEMGKLGSDLNIMTEGLAGITKKITEASSSMASSLEEVKHASDQQSIGVTEQASSINQITASLEEIEKSAAQTMQKAKILGELAEKTSEKGQIGLQAVKQSIEGMKTVRDKVQTIATSILDLSNQTQQVGEITAVVNTLAQQSKMLALNASIEAAKAGEAGKGFAVVAIEIKKLAEQSEQSTVQVQKILEEIRHATEKAVIVTEEGTKGVDQGTLLVEQMGDIVRSLAEAIYETVVASQQIEAAVRQEGLGIEQITAGMNEINSVTASFVATVKQSTESISQLGLIAKNIKEYVDVYTV